MHPRRRLGGDRHSATSLALRGCGGTPNPSMSGPPEPVLAVTSAMVTQAERQRQHVARTSNRVAPSGDDSSPFRGLVDQCGRQTPVCTYAATGLVGRRQIGYPGGRPGPVDIDNTTEIDRSGVRVWCCRHGVGSLSSSLRAPWVIGPGPYPAWWPRPSREDLTDE